MLDQYHLISGETIQTFTDRLRSAVYDPISQEDLHAAIRAFNSEHGRPPHTGDKQETGFGNNWSVMDAALRAGNRGWPGGSSLSEQGKLALGISALDLRGDVLSKLIREFIDEHGEGPKIDSGPIVSKLRIPGLAGNTWKQIHDGLVQGKIRHARRIKPDESH